jgi:hypothetical protein
MPVNTVGPPYSDTMKFAQTVSDYTRLSSESRVSSLSSAS